MDNNSFINYSTTILLIKASIFSPFESLIIEVKELCFNTELIRNIFLGIISPIFDVTFAKSIFVPRNPYSFTKFKFRSFKICLSFFSQSKTIKINRFFTNRTMIIIIIFIYWLIQITKIRFIIYWFYIFIYFSFNVLINLSATTDLPSS